ncbi:MAG: S-layer homology domain-containing protein [Symploca sp. SIO2G7]|nr:S-layer homology domain-containing protein [Symploca sp. SIO2G7]
MLFDQHSARIAILATTCLLSLLTSCSKELERSLAPDPNLEENQDIVEESSPNNSQISQSEQLPQDFPSEMRYPQAQLEKVESLKEADTRGKLTIWLSSDPSNVILSFYQRAFESSNWEIISEPPEDAEVTLVARKQELEVTVSIPSASNNNSQPTTPRNQSLTEFEVKYTRNSEKATVEQSDSKPRESPRQSDLAKEEPQESSTVSTDFSDFDQVPQQLRQYVEDLAALGVLTVEASNSEDNLDTASTQFEPNKTVNRREYARWLVAANNKLHANNQGKQIRLASATAKPVFQDVPSTDPDFPSIQALAEAGLIPSPLSGDATAVTFRPDAPLTRESLILWKVPLDTRQVLPKTSVEAVEQTWGFQDTAKIDPKALRAVLADFQNGESANIRRLLGYTTLFQPKKAVTRAETAAVLWYIGSQGEGISAQEAQELNSSQEKEQE